jgi:ABC-type phosphate/phosphonate transport system substrate-binding protein
MVFNVPETIDSTAVARHEADMGHLQSIVNLLLNMNDEGVEIKAVTRIGPYDSEKAAIKNRPMKVIFTNPQDPIRLLRQGYKLAGQTISIRKDMDPEDRAKMKKALSELHERKNKGEANLVIRNFRVLKRRQPRLIQQPVLLKAHLLP